jgi:ABC-type nitrate/sulfonate/bicarbonate transport system substrate-binding protein
MNYANYGTPEFYKEGFADYFADVDAENPETTKNLIQGLFMAIDEWFEYHDAQAREFADIRKRVRQALAM